MSFGSILRGVYHALTPWHDSGSVFSASSYQQPQKKKRPDQGDQRPAPQSNQDSGGVDQQQPQLQVQRPENLFANLNQHLTVQKPPPNPSVVVTNIPPPKLTPPPQPGTVIPPSQSVQPQHTIPIAPVVKKPSFLDHVGNVFKTAAETAIGTVANVPEVGLAAARAGTGVVQGVTQLPHLVTAAVATGTKNLNDVALDNRFTHVLNTGAQGLNTGIKTATNVVNKPFDFVNRGLDAAAKGYADHVPIAAAGEQVYRREQIPLNILAGLATLGGSTAAEGAGQAGRLGEVSTPGRFTQFINKPLTSSPDNVIAKTGQAVGNKAGPIVQPLFTPVRSTRAGVTRLVNSRTVPNAERGAVDAGETGNVLTNSQLDELTAPPTQVPVTQAAVRDVPIPVGIPRPGVPIRELGGDTPGVVSIPTPQEVAAGRATDRFNNQPLSRPDQHIEGVGNPVTSKDIADAKAVIDDNLATGKISEADHVNLTKQLQDIKPTDVAVPKGQKIEVKQVNTLPVQDKTVVPQNLPEVPGTVRSTTQVSPNDVRTEAVANVPEVVSPTALPADVQAVLDNPKQFNKRQVAAARNQRKLAKQLAKTKADTQAVVDNSPELTPKPNDTAPGFAPTGEFRKGENGNVSEVAHRNTEAAQGAVDTTNLSSGDVLNRASQDIAQNGLVSPESVRNLQAMLDSGRFSQTSPEYRAMAKTLYGAGSQHGRGLSLFNPTLRRTATGDQLANRFVSKLYGVVEDGSKLTDSHIAAVSQADSTFTSARDAANQALDRYNATKAPSDFAAWKQARQAADDAEKHALITEYRVANQVLKGNKDPAAVKALQQAEKDAGVYQMDWIDSSMLSGTGTFARNFVNTSLVRLENAAFGRIGGGYKGAGAKIGNKVGNRSVVTDFKARNELDQNKLSKVVKQWSTTGNMFGEGNINAVGSARAYKFYEDQLKAQGVKGDQLKQDTEVMLHTDPQGMAERYNQWSLSENALSSLTHSKKIEQTLVDAIASKGGGKLSQVGAKALVRLTVGFPTVIGRSLVGGAKRATLGAPDLISAGRAFAGGDTQAMKDALYAAKVHFGSGATLYALGTGLAEAGLISPSYPTDPAEQARWKAEGIQPNSIKIGGSWFGIPGFFGALALPLIIPANVMNKSNPADIVKGVVSGLQDLSPTTGLVNFIDGMEGRNGKQWLKNEISSLTRAATPVGSLLNEIAKMTDSEKNDTTTKDGISNLVDAIAGGIPGVNNAVNKIPATDDSGNILHNPNPVATFFGAQGSQQGQGTKDVQQAQGTANDTYKQLGDSGVLKDKTLMGLVDKKIQAQIARGEKLTPEQITKVQKAVIKGVSDSGEDTAYLEKGQYDTNLAALKVKRDLLSADPTTKPSDLAKLDTSIKRGGIYKDNKIPYEMIDAYKSTSLTDWRSMGNPQSDSYDPEMYQKLWDMDQLMTKAGVSYKKGALDKPKYAAKEAGKGRGGSGRGGGGRGTKQIDTSFGTLKDGTGAPKVQQYDTIDTKSGTIPHISVVRPNIVHKITSSG